MSKIHVTLTLSLITKNTDLISAKKEQWPALLHQTLIQMLCLTTLIKLNSTLASLSRELFLIMTTLQVCSNLKSSLSGFLGEDKRTETHGFINLSQTNSTLSTRHMFSGTLILKGLTGPSHSALFLQSSDGIKIPLFVTISLFSSLIASLLKKLSRTPLRTGQSNLQLMIPIMISKNAATCLNSISPHKCFFLLALE